MQPEEQGIQATRVVMVEVLIALQSCQPGQVESRLRNGLALTMVPCFATC
jgi:hypothetical protein